MRLHDDERGFTLNLAPSRARSATLVGARLLVRLDDLAPAPVHLVESREDHDGAATDNVDGRKDVERHAARGERVARCLLLRLEEDLLRPNGVGGTLQQNARR